VFPVCRVVVGLFRQHMSDPGIEQAREDGVDVGQAERAVTLCST
jgi:hypothetical protein